MNNEERESFDKKGMVSTIIACIFNSTELNDSSGFLSMGELHDKMAYKAKINYINELSNYIIKAINNVISPIPDLEDYIIGGDITNENIKNIIKNDQRLKSSLFCRDDYVFYNGKSIALEDFIDKKDKHMEWIVGKISFLADNLISVYNYGGIEKRGRSK